MEQRVQAVSVQHLPLLKEAVNADDNWTQIKDAKARRRAQNRLNQRAVRRRKEPEKTTHLRSRIDDLQPGHQTLTPYIRSIHKRSSTNAAAAKLVPPYTHATHGTLQPPLSLSLIVHSNHHQAPKIENPDRTHGTHDIILQVSSDHLISLVAHNLYRALLTNMVILGTPNVFNCSLATEHLCLITALPLPSSIPPSLYPTLLQRTVQHPPWIDVFPVPEAHDALIQALGFFDEQELCEDTLPAFALAKRALHGIPEDHEKQERNRMEREDKEQKGLIIWGDPWVAASWEVTPFFLAKWGWMFRGCYDDMLRSTNYWRGIRGENPLRWEESVWCQN